jgi:DNA invertase Pin-like site-specific DNA recombinase
VIGLLRVSTDAQDLARQRTDVARVLASHSLDAARTIELDGVSGRRVQSDPQFQALVRDLARPDIAGVAISALDRLFRPDHYADFSILDHFRESRKLIFSAKEGVLDPASDAGFLMSLMSGAQAGMEWRELRRRSVQGKAEKRAAGLHIDGGAQTLPRGVEFIPERNKQGRIVGGEYRYTEPDASRVRKAYDLLFERRSWQDIAERIGGGFRYRGVAYTLQNPIWRGARRFKSLDGGTFEKQVIAEPLISPERWLQAQALIAGKRRSWLQTRRAEPAPFLCLGIARCVCGRPLYSCHKPAACYYMCQSLTRRYGPACGARMMRREALDTEVDQLFSVRMLDAAFLVPLLQSAIRLTVAAQPDQSRERERLEAKRRRVLDNYEDGYLSRAERDEKMRALDAELAKLQPTVAPASLDAEKLARAIIRLFAGFARLPFRERRERLRALVREVIVEAHAITGLTLAGASPEDGVTTGAKSGKPSIRPCSLQFQSPASEWR